MSNINEIEVTYQSERARIGEVYSQEIAWAIENMTQLVILVYSDGTVEDFEGICRKCKSYTSFSEFYDINGNILACVANDIIKCTYFYS